MCGLIGRSGLFVAYLQHIGAASLPVAVDFTSVFERLTRNW